MPNVMVAGAFLELFGFPYDVAINGNDAVKKFMTGHYAAILMDVQMPGVDGLEATRQIRGIEASTNTRTPIIGMTAHAMVDDREQCLAAGMNDFISKPFNEETLRQKLSHFVSGQSG